MEYGLTEIDEELDIDPQVYHDWMGPQPDEVAGYRNRDRGCPLTNYLKVLYGPDVSVRRDGIRIGIYLYKSPQWVKIFVHKVDNSGLAGTEVMLYEAYQFLRDSMEELGLEPKYLPSEVFARKMRERYAKSAMPRPCLAVR